jgi:hypothetical protein
MAAPTAAFGSETWGQQRTMKQKKICVVMLLCPPFNLSPVQIGMLF